MHLQFVNNFNFFLYNLRRQCVTARPAIIYAASNLTNAFLGNPSCVVKCRRSAVFVCNGGDSRHLLLQ